MNWPVTKLNTSPLSVALTFSVLLHIIGFYFLSGLTFDSTVNISEAALIKIRPFLERKGVKPSSVTHVTEVAINESSQFLRPTFRSPEKQFLPYTVSSHKKSNLIQSKQLVPQPHYPKNINPISLASIENSPQKHVNSQSNSRDLMPKAMPRKFENNPHMMKKSNHLVKVEEVSTSPAEQILHTTLFQARTSSNLNSNILQKFASTLVLGDTQIRESNKLSPKARLISKSKMNVSQKSKSGSLLVNKPFKQNNYASPTIRTIALDSKFSEEPYHTPNIDDINKTKPPGSNEVSESETGELRQAFLRKIWHKITSVKYYPRIARKRGFEGKPVVSFTLGLHGELLTLKLIQSSNYNLLNEAALETIRRGIPYPPIPKPLGQESILFNLPILYVLEE